MIEIGRVCVKLAGRDAGSKCVVVDVLDGRNVLIDGESRRRKCNMSHLEPLPERIDLKKGASHSDVVAAFKTMGITAREAKTHKTPKRPLSKRSVAPAKAAKAPAVKPAKKV